MPYSKVHAAVARGVSLSLLTDSTHDVTGSTAGRREGRAARVLLRLYVRIDRSILPRHLPPEPCEHAVNSKHSPNTIPRQSLASALLSLVVAELLRVRQRRVPVVPALDGQRFRVGRDQRRHQAQRGQAVPLGAINAATFFLDFFCSICSLRAAQLRGPRDARASGWVLRGA